MRDQNFEPPLLSKQEKLPNKEIFFIFNTCWLFNLKCNRSRSQTDLIVDSQVVGKTTQSIWILYLEIWNHNIYVWKQFKVFKNKLGCRYRHVLITRCSVISTRWVSLSVLYYSYRGILLSVFMKKPDNPY